VHLSRVDDRRLGVLGDETNDDDDLLAGRQITKDVSARGKVVTVNVVSFLIRMVKVRYSPT
jgi:hypothetical protein